MLLLPFLLLPSDGLKFSMKKITGAASPVPFNLTLYKVSFTVHVKKNHIASNIAHTRHSVSK